MRPQSLWLKGLLLFLAALFLTTLFLSCHVSILPFHSSWMCGLSLITAIDDCIDSMKIEVKQKIDDQLDGGRQSEMREGAPLSHSIPIFVKT